MCQVAPLSVSNAFPFPRVKAHLMPSKSAAPHVALLIETSRTYGRELLHGVRKYVAERGPWSLFVESRSLESPAPPWLPGWSGNGILTRSGSQAMVDAVKRAKVPTVELRSTRLKHSFPFVGVNNCSLGKLVADLRRRLSVDDCRRLAVMLTGSGDETDCE